VFKSRAYSDWLKQAGWEIKAQRTDRIEGHHKLSMEVGRPDNRRRDLDNLIKPEQDLLVSLGIVTDDSKCIALSARWADFADDLVVTLEPA